MTPISLPLDAVAVQIGHLLANQPLAGLLFLHHLLFNDQFNVVVSEYEFCFKAAARVLVGRELQHTIISSIQAKRLPQLMIAGTGRKSCTIVQSWHSYMTYMLLVELGPQWGRMIQVGSVMAAYRGCAEQASPGQLGFQTISLSLAATILPLIMLTNHGLIRMGGIASWRSSGPCFFPCPG